MATYRIGIGSFNLKDGAVGIGTESTGLGNLKVEGTIKTTDLDVGVSTFTRYSGFEAEQTNIIRDQTLSGEYSTTGDIVVDTGNTLTVGLGSTACIGSVECISVKHHFSVPVGNTAGRNKSSGYAEGTVRYNRDLGTMEFFNGNEWRQFTYIADIKTNPQGRGRALFCGGDTTPSGSYTNHIDFCTISSTGSTRSFGDATSAHMTSYGIGNNSRGIFHVGGGPSNTLEYVTIPSEGDSIDFGNLSSARYAGARGNSSTRGIFMGGSPGPSNVIDYVEMMTLGNALDFGDLNQGVYVNPNSVNSKIRAFSLGGYITPGINTSDVESVKISSKGNAIKFGSIHKPISSLPGFSNDTRAIYGGGILRPGATSNIYIFNMFTQGESSFFGDLTQARYEFAGSCSQTRGVFAGGQLPDSPYPSVNTMDFITMASTGNAIDFGDMSKVARNLTSLSDCHGGLGGY